jgi:Fic family protein
MESGESPYIWQAVDWPTWRYDLTALATPMAEVSLAQGMLLGRLADLGMALRDQASLAALTEDVVRTSEIEGEQLPVASVRSSLARRLGVDIGALAPVDRHAEGVVEMVLDATSRCEAPLTKERLLGWHAALFQPVPEPSRAARMAPPELGQEGDRSGTGRPTSEPDAAWREVPPSALRDVASRAPGVVAELERCDHIAPRSAPSQITRLTDVAACGGFGTGWIPTGTSGLARIRVGAWREDATGPMQVISGPPHRQRVHFEAPPAERLEREMAALLAWVEGSTSDPPLLKAGLGHLWFVTIHPFEDGNGRMARAVGDLLLARIDGSQRFYSLSAQIQRERKAYYEVMERTQHGSMDVTEWLAWFLGTLHRAIKNAEHTLDAVLTKARFWQRCAGIPLNERQAKLLNRLLEGFEGKLTSSKWATLAKCSSDTALRDINELVAVGILRRAPGGGRSTAYELEA